MSDPSFVATSLALPSLYDYAHHPEFITVRRMDLEACIRTTIEKAWVCGGNIQELARDCMIALDIAAATEG